MTDYRERMRPLSRANACGKPCVRSMRIAVYDVLDWLASGMSESEIVEDYPD